MKLVILGAKGMLGTDLVRACERSGLEAVGRDLPELDITEPKQLERELPSGDWVINCAAYTRVDDAERERDQAFALNAEAPRYLAGICAGRGTPFMHISTDYIFDGSAGTPYRENARPNPINVYGAGKLAGEKAIRAQGGHYIIVRTQSLFGVHGPNFVKTIAGKLRESDAPLRVVNDQVSAPTWTGHLAEALVKLARLKQKGVVHVTASGFCSWYDFACAIADRVKPDARIEPVSSDEMKRPAARPPFSVLDNSRFLSWTGEALPSWEEGLEAYLKEEGALL